MRHQIELLAPAGSFESLRAAVNAGADAVYIGGSRFGARAYADNPDEEGLCQAIRFAHLHGCDLYLTVNTLLKDEELESLLDQKTEPDTAAGGAGGSDTASEAGIPFMVQNQSNQPGQPRQNHSTGRRYSGNNRNTKQN